MDIYSTYYMLAAVREMRPEHTFFKRRYFPTNTSLDVFGSTKVLADYKKNSQKRAPFVIPRIGSVSVGREGFSTYELEPPNIALSMPLTADQLNNRGFGESIMSTATPADRARMLLMGDLSELSARISRTEEWLAVQTMMDNGCTMRHQTEREDIYEDISVQFYDGENNPALYTPAAPWTHTTENADGSLSIGNWYYDVCNMVKMLTGRGLPARELLVASDVGEFLLEDLWIQKALDNRRMEMGRIAPAELTEYITELGTFNFMGRNLTILVSDGTFEEDNKDVPYVPLGTAIVTAPDCGKGLYGAVTQLENDGNFHTYAGTRVPQHIFTIKPPVKETQLTARPLLVPKRKSPWSVAKSVFD
jgi:hypothetical protein